ncbi:uncharacterized protein LOC128745690 [Sabethes cyaneus]|uniref:uncharacterized protein LOC128745690 n=1 Tax=Sabethes cyaneus TaxID=53552 RepID=UPI00237D783A|nr:uncharacterized protein LOC128745690 [Sabethes cyaneus]
MCEYIGAGRLLLLDLWRGNHSIYERLLLELADAFGEGCCLRGTLAAFGVGCFVRLELLLAGERLVLIEQICYSSLFNERLKHHPKSFWNYENEQRKESGLPSSMEYNGEVAATQDACRFFSKQFASVFTNEVLSADRVALAANNVPIYGHTLGAIDINVDMISKAVTMLKSSFNLGPYGVPSVFLKSHIDCLLTPLLRLFQMSISSAIFPSCWKFAHMFSVHKKGSKRDVDNYRGITSLNAISKLFELVFMELLLSHCKQYVSADQHGFTFQRFTTTTLLCLTSYITEGIAQRAQTDVLYIELSTAFD